MMSRVSFQTCSLFSSISATLGNPGQANYAAANAILEAMTHMYQSQGVEVTAQGWGPWAVAGMAVQQPALLTRLKQQGNCSMLTSLEQSQSVTAQCLIALYLSGSACQESQDPHLPSVRKPVLLEMIT